MIDELSETEGFDYIFLDCRSGMGAKMPETMGISDDAMVFFRWSKQHREGTKIIANNYLQGVLLNRDATALAIGNSIPERTGEDDIEDFVKKLDPVEEHFSIRESDALKHEERVLLENRSLETDTAEDFDKIVDYVSDNL
jgi:MinD-like ATPase involved in chromosome partitioning or flagellar assembly